MAQMETAFPDAKLPVPSYVMESSSNHPCHRLSIPAARLFWCRHCMQIFEDPITRWRHSKTCLNSSSRNVKKDRDGRTMQVFVNADNLSHCQREENKLKSVSRGVGTGKSPSADLRCRICKKTFLSIEEMRTHVRTPCRKRPSMGISKHKYTARHKDMGAPIQIPDSTSEIIYIKDGHQTVFSLESQSSQPEGIKTEPVEPQPSNFKENAFQYGSCGEDEVIIIPDTFDNTSNLNTIEQTVEITAVEMVPPVVSKSEEIMKQCCKSKENKENNVRKRKRVIPKEIEERPNLKTNVTSSPKGDQQIPSAPLPSVTETPPKDVPDDVESSMVKIAKVMKDLEDLLLKQPTTENEVDEKIEEFPSDDSKGLVTDNLPNDVITQLCEDAPEKVEIPPDKDVSSDENAESCLKDLLFTSVKMKNQVKLSPKNVKSINLSAVSPQKTSNSNSKCTVRKDLNKSSLSPVPQDNLCLDLFMPVNACSVTLPDPLLDIKNGMPAEVLLDETTSTKPPVAAALLETISSRDSAELKEENKLPSYIFEGDLLPLQEHSDVLFEESTIDEKESSEESIIQPVEEVTEVKDCLSSSTDMVATENEQPLKKVFQDKALVSTVSEPLIKESSVSEMISFEIPVEEIQAIPNEFQVTSLDSASDEMTEDDISKVKEHKEVVQQSDLHLEDQHSDPHVEDQQPYEVQLKDQQPDEVQLKGQQPYEVQLKGQQPYEVQLKGQQPYEVQLKDQQPELEMEKPQAKEYQVREQPEEHQMKEIKAEECKMEEHKVERPHIKDHHKEHHQIEEVDEIPNREEELEPQEEESSRQKERKIFSGKHESELKLQKSPKLFKCKACSNTFKTSQALQKHSRVPCKVKHTRSLCQKILRPKRPCVKIEKKPVKKKVVKPPKRPKLMVPIVPITRQEVVRPATPKRPRRFSRRKRRKSSFIDEQKRILPFVNVLMSELSVKDLFFYKLGLINNSCKPTPSTSTSEVMSETLSICKLGKDKSLIVRRTSADLPPFDNNLEMTNSSVHPVDSALISGVFNDCSLPEGKRKPSVDISYMPVLESMTSATDEDCFEHENHQSQDHSKNDIEDAAASSLEISVPQAKSDSNFQNQPSVLCKEENLSLKKDSDLSSVTCDLKDSFTTDDKSKTCTDSDQSEPESLPVFHTSDSVKLLRKKLRQECSNPISILAQDSRNQHLSTNELCKPPTLDSASDDAKSETKKHTVFEGDQYLTQKSEQQTTIEKIDNSSVNDSKKRTQTGKEPSNSSAVSSDISPLVSNETIAQSNSLANQSRNSSLSPLVSSLKDATDITPATDNNSDFHSKSDLDSENKSSDVNSENESSTSLPPFDIDDKNVRTEWLGVCLPSQRSQSPNIPAADSPTSDKHLDFEHLVDNHKQSTDVSVSLCSTQPLHIETSNSLSKKLDVSHSAKQRHFSDIFGNEKSSLVEKDNSNDQHCQISPSKERSKRHFTDFLSSLSENSVNNAQHPEPTHLPECTLSRRDNISKTCGNSSSNQIAKRSDADPCVSCQHAADTAQNVNQTCHNARCVPEEAKNPTVDVNKSHQISPVKKRTHCYCGSAVPSVSIEPANAMHRSQCPCCQHQVSNPLEPGSADAGSISKSCLHTDNVSDSVISSFDACAQGCPLKVQDNTLHDNAHAAAHVLSLVSLPSSSVHMNMAWSTNVCRAALSADSSGDPCAFSKQTTLCVPLNSSTKTGGGTESPLQNSSLQHHHCRHHHHHSCIPTTPPTSSTSSSSSSSSSSLSGCITSISSSTATVCSTTTPSSTATSSKDVHKPNITLNAESITEVPDKNLTPTLCVAATNSTEHSNDCCSTAANALTIVVENTDSSATASNTNRIAVAASCSESSSSETQTRCNCSGKFCLPRQKLKGALCLGNNEDKLSVFCNCCSSNNSSSSINSNNNNNIHHLHHHHHHHHNCNSNTASSFLNAKGPLIPESVACLCSKRLETRSAVLKGESNIKSYKNPFQSRVIPSSVICVKRSLNPRISVATQTESSFLKEVKVVPAVSSTSEATKTCDSIKVTTDPSRSSSLQTCPKQIPEPPSLEQQLTSEEVVQEEILLDANTLPVVGETLINNQLPAAGSEEIQSDTERKDSPVSNSLLCASDSTQLACSSKASNSVSSSPTNIPTSIGATELMAVSSVGSESNVYVQYVGEFDPSLLPEEVTFVIIQGESGEGVPVADGQSLIIEGSGFEEPTDGTSVPLQANIPVAYALQQREDIAGDSECIVSEM
ncbi:serine-rich adhesin for platelets-like isoform X2 [Octopus sinensis]|uniref:Serine-rich adhesin for platelets-like isoform X2 n=1 Tax=Octopus sinensis TaxID=2607531 RepID=A0A7E6F202_9MOLL|nr:serine-rich adhesin for platelets-like isoform X2 [Octopus sinensis]